MEGILEDSINRTIYKPIEQEGEEINIEGNQEKGEEPKAAKQVEKSKETLKLNGSKGKGLIPKSNLNNIKLLPKLNENISEEENIKSNQSVRKKNDWIFISERKDDENSEPKGSAKEIPLIEPKKNEEENRMIESKGNIEENLTLKESKKEIEILEPQRKEEKDVESKKKELNNRKSKGNDQEIEVAKPKPDQEKNPVSEPKPDQEKNPVPEPTPDQEKNRVPEPKPDQEKSPVSEPKAEPKLNEEEESNLKDIKSKILKITKPVMEKKAAETLEILRQDKVLEEKSDASAPKFLDGKMDKEDGEIQNGTKPVVPTEGKREILFKILVVGELGTGKTSIIKRYVHEFFSQNYRATIGVDFALKVLDWDQNTLIRIQLWDIAGQERFGSMTRVYYKDAVGAFIVFDVTRNVTLEAVAKWKEDLDSKVQLSNGSPIPCILLANKCDQQKEGLVNNKSKMDEYCKEKGFITWFETSAKENINIEEATKSLITKLLQNDTLISNGERVKDIDKFVLAQKTEKEDKSSCLC